MDLVGSLRARWARFRSLPPRQIAVALAPWAATFLGLGLALLSLMPDIVSLDPVELTGSVGPRSDVSRGFPYTGYSFAHLDLEQVSSCALRVYVLGPEAAAAYNASSILPPPSESLQCDRAEAAFEGPIALLVFRNEFNGTESYRFLVRPFASRYPYALWSLVALPLLLVGSVVIAVGVMRRGIVDLVDEIAERRAAREEPSREPPAGPDDETRNEKR